MIKKIVIVLFLCLYINESYGQFRKLEKRNHQVNKVLGAIKNSNDFKNAGFAFIAIDSKSGKIISKHNPDMALKPASTQKLFSTASVLELYSPDYQFTTTIQYTGTIDTINHILHGNIYIKGSGDPTLGSKYFDETKNKQFIKQWIKAIKKLKIDSVAGAIIADASIYSKEMIPVTWSWNDIGNYYGAGACGLSIYDNYYSVFFNSGNKVGDTTTIARTKPKIPSLCFENEVIADSISYDNAYIYGAPYSYSRLLKGEIPLNQKDFEVKGSIPDPAYFAAVELENSLKENGLKIRDNASSVRLLNLKKIHQTDIRKEIVTIYSPKLSEIIAQTNIHSINLFAEHCLNHSGLKLTGNAETDKSTKALMKFWKEKGMDIQGLSLTDGSGLAHYNVITPRQMVFLLNYMKNNSKNYSYFYNSLAIAGKTGTIRNMFKGSPAEGNLRAKSGTISGVKAYAGYVKSIGGRDIIFSMVVNNFSCTSREARSHLEKLMIAMAEFKK